MHLSGFKMNPVFGWLLYSDLYFYLILKLSISVELKLIRYIQSRRDSDTNFDCDAPWFFRDESRDARIGLSDAVLVKDADDLTDFLIGNAPVEVKARSGRTVAERILNEQKIYILNLFWFTANTVSASLS